MLSINTERRGIAERARALRLATRLTQQGLADRSGVSLGSVKRFERTGQIALTALLQIAVVLRCPEDFRVLFMERTTSGHLSLDALLRRPKARQRGSVT